MKITIYTDWGSRWNPGIAGIWVYIVDENGKEIEKRYKFLGKKTNNEAEYLWAYYGLKRWIELGANHIDLKMDSDLVIQQLSGTWKIKKAELKEIHTQIKNMIWESWVQVNFIWIPREQNKEADRLSNKAMDAEE